jgi:hypothetical protein
MSFLLAWTPFLDPVPIWSNAVWPWMLIPMAAAVSIVYKSIKCRTMSQVPREATEIFFTIILGMIAAAVVLAGVVQALEWAAR